MCGIFGGSAKVGKKLDLKKIATLGVYNIQRGTDSCGYYYSGNVEKGVDKEANFTQFIDKNKITRGKLKGEVFLGHTRKSTFGAHTAENAHPHVVENYVQTHNGTLTKPWELCDKYNVNHKDITVDSIGLARIIQKVGFEVLHHYQGYAALAMTFMDDSESLYLYHGASKEKTGGEVWEERPLFILKQPEGIYYSSIEESLNFISCNKNKAETLPHNCVFKIVNGILTPYEYIVSREDNNIKTPVSYTYPAYTAPKPKQLNLGYGGYDRFDDEFWPTLPSDKAPKDPSILLEDYPDNFITQDIYYRRGRYYKDENILLHGKYNISRDGFIEELNPQNMKGKVVETYYFIRGIMMASENMYKKALETEGENITNLDVNNAYFLSKYSRYPVTAIESESLLVADDIKTSWYKNGGLFDGTFTPKFTERRYKIVKGKLKSIDNSKCNIYLTEVPRGYYDVLDTQEQEQVGGCCSTIDPKLEEIAQLVTEWSNKKIEEKDVTQLPEAFLLYVDQYIRTYQPDISDKEVERETTAIIKDLIKCNMTFNEYLLQYNEDSFTCYDLIIKCFRDEDYAGILYEENRYQFIGFNEEDENILYSVAEVKDLLDDLTKEADNLQALNNDKAQELAYAIYVLIPGVEKVISEMNIKSKESTPF